MKRKDRHERMKEKFILQKSRIIRFNPCDKRRCHSGWKLFSTSSSIIIEWVIALDTVSLSFHTDLSLEKRLSIASSPALRIDFPESRIMIMPFNSSTAHPDTILSKTHCKIVDFPTPFLPTIAVIPAIVSGKKSYGRIFSLKESFFVFESYST